MDHKKIIIILIIIIAILLASILYVVMNNENKELELKTEDFEYFTMSVPVESNFQLNKNYDKGSGYWTKCYDNTNDEIVGISSVWISNYQPKNNQFEYVGTEGDMKIYTVPNVHGIIVERYVDGYYIEVMGINDLDLVKQLAKTIKPKN